MTTKENANANTIPVASPHDILVTKDAPDTLASQAADAVSSILPEPVASPHASAKLMALLEQQHLQPEFMKSTATIAYQKYTTRKHEYNKRNAETKKILVKMRAALRSFLKRNEAFTAGAHAAEERLHQRARQLTARITALAQFKDHAIEQVEMYQKQAQEALLAQKRVEGQVDALHTNIATLETGVRHAHQQLQEAQTAQQEAAAREAAIRETHAATHAQLQQAQTDAAAAVDAVQAKWQPQLEQAQRELEKAHAATQEAMTKAQQANARVHDVEATHHQHMEQLRASREQMDAMRTELQQQSTEMTALEAKATQQEALWQDRLARAGEERQRVQTQCDTLLEKRDALVEESTRVAAKLEEATRQHSVQRETLAQSHAQLAAVQAQLDKQVALVATVQEQLQASREETATVTQAATAAQLQVEADRAAWAEERGTLQLAHAQAVAQLEKMQQAVTETEQERKQLESSLAVAQQAATEAGAARDTLAAALDASEQRVVAVETRMAEGVEDSAKVRALEAHVAQLTSVLGSRDDAVAQLAEARARLAEQAEQLFAAEQARRKLHNALCDLRGNVRVMVRTRPALGAEQTESVVHCHPDGERMRITVGETDHRYNFDRILDASSSQHDVFGHVSDLVQSALDGYNCAIFSYGQTGSGKTHTMLGVGEGDTRGIIPRAVELVMATALRLQDQGWEYEMTATFVEVYNERVRDLLSHADELEVRLHEETGYPCVPGAERVTIAGPGDMTSLMSRAQRARATAATEMNARSSRSHSVFTLFLVGRNARKGAELRGSLNLCDLAGSERLSRSGATGQRLRETQNINRSLSALGDVFAALQKNQSHVPFRNSKLTFLLKNCFSGDGKALMLVCLSPTRPSAEESLCSLRFAAKVNATELGQAKRNIRAVSNKSKTPKAIRKGKKRPSDEGLKRSVKKMKK